MTDPTNDGQTTVEDDSKHLIRIFNHWANKMKEGMRESLTFFTSTIYVIQLFYSLIYKNKS